MITDLYLRLKPAPKSEDWEDYFHGRETLLWEGAPEPVIRNLGMSIFLTIFGVPFLGTGLAVIGGGLLNIFSFAESAHFWTGIFMVFFGLPFLAVGVGLTFGTLFFARNHHLFVRYGLSNKRAYVAKSLWNHTMESYPITAESYLALEQGKTDTVWFSKLASKDSDGDKSVTKVGFEGIADGPKVYALLRDIQEQRAQERR